MATFCSLIDVFERAGHRDYAEFVKHIRDKEMMFQQSCEMSDDCIPSSPPLPPQPSTYPKLQSPRFPCTPASIESFVLEEGVNSSEG